MTLRNALGPATSLTLQSDPNTGKWRFTFRYATVAGTRTLLIVKSPTIYASCLDAYMAALEMARNSSEDEG